MPPPHGRAGRRRKRRDQRKIPAHPITGTVRPPDRSERCGGQQFVDPRTAAPLDRRKSREKPRQARFSSRANGRCHAATGLLKPRGRVLPVSPASKCAWREHHEQTAGRTPPSFMVFKTVELSDRSAIRTCVEKNHLVQAGHRFANFWTDRFWTGRVQ